MYGVAVVEVRIVAAQKKANISVMTMVVMCGIAYMHRAPTS